MIHDEGRDWFDLLGMGFNVLATLAGLFGLFLAIRAYKVSAEAYRIAKEQGRKTFELEILRELGKVIERSVEITRQKPQRYPLINVPQTNGLFLLPVADVTLWRSTLSAVQARGDEEQLLKHPLLSSRFQDKDASDDSVFLRSLHAALYAELHEAMRKRTE